ncbi:MAG: AAA family ATPase [Sphingopyxis sp.]|nr:AAA family ATPase [Sphingopyxis sp.]
MGMVVGRAKTKAGNIEVIVARSDKLARALKQRPLLAIIPDRDNWNDYSYRHFADLILFGADGEETPFQLRLMFENEKNTFDFLSGQFGERGETFPLDTVETRYCALLGEVTGYRDLVALLGFDDAIGGLRKLHDVVLANIEGEDQDILTLMTGDPFHLGMIRNAPRYTAYRRGGRFLRRTPVPTVNDAASSFSIEARLPAYEQPIEVDLDFSPDEIFDDRCCVLIGRNGVGKTQLLHAMIEAIERQETETADDVVAASFTLGSPAFSRVLVFSSVQSDPYPKAIPPWAGIDYEYFAVAADVEPLGRSFIQCVVDCLRDDSSSFGSDAMRSERYQLLQAMLEKLGFLDDLYLPIAEDSEDGFHDLHSIGDDLFVGFAQRFIERDQNRLAALIDLGRPAIILSDDRTPRRLSSGELAMAQFVAQAVASVENGSLLLLDEPETHLHPNYISTFMDILQDLLDRTKSIAIIATHSAYVVREVPRQRVNVLSRDADGLLTSDRPRMQTFGANIDELSQFVFDDWAMPARYRRRLAEWGRAKVSEIGIEGVLGEYGDQLSPVTLTLIARAARGDEIA